MTTDTNSMLNTVKEAFAPVTEAFTKLQNMEVPEAAREFVKKQAETAKERAAEAYAGSEKVTAAIETAVPGRGSVLRRHRQARFGQVAERSLPDPVRPRSRPRRSAGQPRQGDCRICRQARDRRC